VRRLSLDGLFGSMLIEMLIEDVRFDVATLEDRQDARRTRTGRTRS
jgi:hypothetical protein